MVPDIVIGNVISAVPAIIEKPLEDEVKLISLLPEYK